MKELLKRMLTVNNLLWCIVLFGIGFAFTFSRGMKQQQPLETKTQVTEFRQMQNQGPATDTPFKAAKTAFIEEIWYALSQEGYHPYMDDEGEDLGFKCEGQSYLVESDPRDSLYFYMLLPNIYKTDQGDKDKILEIVNRITGDKKVVKVWLEETNFVSISYERFCQSGDNLLPIVQDAISCIKSAEIDFYYELKKE